MKKYRVCSELTVNGRINYFIQKRFLWLFWRRVILFEYTNAGQPNYSDREKAERAATELNKQ